MFEFGLCISSVASTFSTLVIRVTNDAGHLSTLERELVRFNVFIETNGNSLVFVYLCIWLYLHIQIFSYLYLGVIVYLCICKKPPVFGAVPCDAGKGGHIWVHEEHVSTIYNHSETGTP